MFAGGVGWMFRAPRKIKFDRRMRILRGLVLFPIDPGGFSGAGVVSPSYTEVVVYLTISGLYRELGKVVSTGGVDEDVLELQRRVEKVYSLLSSRRDWWNVLRDPSDVDVLDLVDVVLRSHVQSRLVIIRDLVARRTRSGVRDYVKLHGELSKIQARLERVMDSLSKIEEVRRAVYRRLSRRALRAIEEVYGERGEGVSDEELERMLRERGVLVADVRAARIYYELYREYRRVLESGLDPREDEIFSRLYDRLREEYGFVVEEAPEEISLV